MRPECSQYKARLREICEGSADLSKEKCNTYRINWGLPPMADDEFPVVDRQPRVIHQSAPAPKQRAAAPRKKKGRGCSSCGKPGPSGPGTELLAIMKAKGVPSCQACKNMATQMDRWGVQGCRKKMDAILTDMMPRARAWVEENKPWASTLLPNAIKDIGIRRQLKAYVTDAIAAAEKKTPARKKPGRSTLKQAIAEPVVFRRRQTQTWAVGFTIAKRPTPSWQRAVTSCRDAGFDPYLFAEPDVPIGNGKRHVQRPNTIADQMFSTLGPNGLFGAHQNYMQALSDLLAAEPDAEMVLYAQDDCFFPPGTREILESIRWPDDADLLSLWCPSGHGYMHGSPGLCPTPKKDIIGAIAFAMPRSTAELLISSPHMLQWAGSAGGHRGHRRKTLDMATGRALHEHGMTPYYFTRSIVDHFEPAEANSAVGNGAVRGFRKSHLYVGDNASADVVREVYQGSEVHVVIPAHECLGLTLSCLDALWSSTVDVHVCYVDNGSSNETLQAVAQSLTRFSHIIVSNEDNEGFTKAVQQGIDLADGRDVLVLNNDCRVSPNTIEELLACMSANPMTAAVCPVTDDRGACSVRLAKNETLTTLGTSREHPQLPWFCCLLNRHAVKQTPNLPADAAVSSGLAVDDWWCHQVRAKGWSCRITGAAFAEHDHSATFLATGQDRTAMQQQAQKWLAKQ